MIATEKRERHLSSEETGPQADSERRFFRSLQVQSPRRILIVDDDYDSIKLLQRVLTEFGCYIQIAMEGRQAVKFLRDSWFDLVFLDWKMPDIGGRETIEEAEKAIAKVEDARSFWKAKKQAVVTFSGYKDSQFKLPHAAHFSFVDHWTKPMDFGDLYFHVREILNFISNPLH